MNLPLHKDSVSLWRHCKFNLLRQIRSWPVKLSEKSSVGRSELHSVKVLSRTMRGSLALSSAGGGFSNSDLVKMPPPWNLCCELVTGWPVAVHAFCLKGFLAVYTSCDHSWLTDHISYIVNTINSDAGAIRCLCALTSYLRTFHFWRLQSGFAYRTCNSTLPRFFLMTFVYLVAMSQELRHHWKLCASSGLHRCFWHFVVIPMRTCIHTCI